MLLGNGDGTFKPAISDVGGANAYAFAAADFDGDKKLDLVIVTSGTLYVELGLGTGKFAGEVFETSAASFPGSVVVGDFNGDKKPDLAVTGNGAQPGNDFIDVLLGNGDGTFQTAVGYPVGLGTNSLGLADLDGDGKLDLIVTNAGITAAGGDHVDVLLGNGDGTFQAAAAYGVATSPISLAVGDFNGDGLPDVATANGAVSNNFAVSSDVSVLLGKGDGSLLTAPRYGVTAGAQNGGRFLVAGDFNGDCLQDLAIENPLSQPNGSFTIRVSVLLANAAGGFQPSIDSVVDTGISDDASETMVAADFDSNGKLDLVVTAPPGAFLLSGNGDGTFQKGVPVSSSSYISGPVDFNADGRADMAESGAVLLGNGDGTFKYVFNTAIGSLAPVIGHFDAGPTLDIASESSVLLGNGDGTFSTVAASNLGTAVAVAGGDLNGDGKLDLLVFQQSSQLLQVALGNGDGTFQDSIPTPPVANFPGSWQLLDINGDGNLDVVTNKYEQDVVAVLLGHGDGSFASELDYAVGLGPGSMISANLGALGTPSIVVADSLGNDVTALNQTSCVP